MVSQLGTHTVWEHRGCLCLRSTSSHREKVTGLIPTSSSCAHLTCSWQHLDSQPASEQENA